MRPISEETAIKTSQAWHLDDEIAEVCRHFLEQVKALSQIDALTVVLNDTQGKAGRVVFSWKSSSESLIHYAGDPAALASPAVADNSSINLPIQGNYGFLGTLLVHTPLGGGFPAHERRMLGDLLKMLAIRLENIQLHRRIQTTALEIDLIDEIAHIVSSTHDLVEVYNRCAQSIQKLVPFDRICISVIDPENEEFAFAYAEGPVLPGELAGRLSPLHTSTNSRLWFTGETVIRSDISIEPRFETDRPLVQLGLRSVISVPLIASGIEVGTLTLHHRNSHVYGYREQSTLERLACQIAVTVESAHLEERIRATTLKSRLLDSVTTIVARARNLEDLFNRLYSILGQSIDLDSARLSWITSRDSDCTIDSLETSQPTTNGRASRGGVHGVSLPFRVAAPLSYRNSVIGSLELSRQGSPFQAHEQDILHLVANQIAPAVRNAVLQQLNMRQAYQLQQKSNAAIHSQEPTEYSSNQITEPISQLAHALYSPLTSIKGYTGSLLQPDTDWPEEVRQEFLKTIEQAADRLDHAIRDLVLPRRSDASTGAKDGRSARVQDVFKQLELEFAESSIGLRFECDPRLSPVRIKADVIERVLRYMIECANGYTAAPADLQLTAAAHKGSVLISLEFTQRPFQSGQPPLEGDLRVAVCRKILEPLGASLSVKVMDNGGVKLGFAVPFAQQGPEV